MEMTFGTCLVLMKWVVKVYSQAVESSIQNQFCTLPPAKAIHSMSNMDSLPGWVGSLVPMMWAAVGLIEVRLELCTN
jgi:hypothetical protein